MSQQGRFSVAAAIVSICGMLAIAFATQAGAGLSPDSRGYLAGARFLLRGQGISNVNGNGEVVPMTHFAPLYPILLAGTGAGGDPLDRARWLSISLFGLSIFLAGLLVYRASAQSALAGVIASILVAASFDLMRVYAMVWSEPAFICFMLAGFVFLAKYLRSLRLPCLILGSLAIACAFTTRYSGAALVVSTGLVVLLHPSRPIKQRLIDTLIYGALSILPMVAWIARNLIRADSAADREAAFHPPNWSDVRLSLTTLANWFVPIPFDKTAIIVILSVAVGLIVLVLLLRTRFVATPDSEAGARTTPAAPLLAAFSIVYVLFLLFSVSFVDAHTPLDYRILSPLYVALLLWAIIALLRFARTPSARLVLALAFCLFFASQATRSAAWARNTSKTGIGFGARSWKDSPTLKYLGELPAGTLLYSNAPDLIDFRVNRFAKPVPKVTNPITRKPEKTYRPYLMGLRDDLATRGGYIIWFKLRSASRWYLVTEDQLKTDLSLQTVRAFKDATIYRLAPVPATTHAP